MDFGGHYRLEAPRRAVWAALNDTETLKAAIPGCRRIDWVGEDALEIELEVNLGLAKPVFIGDLSLSEVVPATSYVLSGRGRGALLGLAEGAARITLADIGEAATDMRFTAEGGASGRIMALGKAVVGDRAQRVIDGFFERFAAAMGTRLTVLDPA